MKTRKRKRQTLETIRQYLAKYRSSVRVMAFDIGILRDRVTSRADRVIPVYYKIHGIRPDLTFIQFARLLDPTIPVQAAEYRRHPSYVALCYMKRTYDFTHYCPPATFGTLAYLRSKAPKT